MRTRQAIVPCGVLFAAAVLVMAGVSAPAQGQKDKGKPALGGVWMQQGGMMKIEFADKDVVKMFPHGDGKDIVVVCSYAVDKDKRVKAKITDLEGDKAAKAKEILPLGLEFSFTWQVKGDVATLGDVQGKNVDVLKGHLEGKFDKK
jgi:hypothetical protein